MMCDAVRLRQPRPGIQAANASVNGAAFGFRLLEEPQKAPGSELKRNTGTSVRVKMIHTDTLLLPHRQGNRESDASARHSPFSDCIRQQYAFCTLKTSDLIV